MRKRKILIIGAGNAALCAGISALEQGAEVLILEKAPYAEAFGNSRYTAGAMRFAYHAQAEIVALLSNAHDLRIRQTNFGSYPKSKFKEDLLNFNGGKQLSLQQQILVEHSYASIKWLASHGVEFEPIYSRQSFQKDGKHIFWGGLTLAAKGEGEGLVQAELAEFLRLGGKIYYETKAIELLKEKAEIKGIICETSSGEKTFLANKVILACGGFEANPDLRKKFLGADWDKAKVRGTPHNMGIGIEMALKAGAAFHGLAEGCHAVPMDLHMPDYGNLDIPYQDRKRYRKICYFLGIMLNAQGKRFVDEGKNFRNYTYAQFGKAILHQPGAFAWQVFDSKVADLLYDEYSFWDASFVEANTLEDLVAKMDGVHKEQSLATLHAYNKAVDDAIAFDPTILDGKCTQGLTLNKSNWANKIDTPPFKAFPVTCGITFTYGGLQVNEKAEVLDTNGQAISGLYACGELVGGVFYHGYPGGSGLTSGAVFGKLAGTWASK